MLDCSWCRGFPPDTEQPALRPALHLVIRKADTTTAERHGAREFVAATEAPERGAREPMISRISETRMKSHHVTQDRQGRCLRGLPGLKAHR